MKTMKSFRRVAVALTMAIVIFSIPAFSVRAATSVPTIKEIKERTNKSVVLEIKNKDLKKKHVRMKIEVKNKKTDKEKTVEKTAKLSSSGKIDVLIDGLNSGTNYQFKVKMKKDSDSGDYSDWSEKESEETKD